MISTSCNSNQVPLLLPPLFVVGCDRSGTTLLTSLIESRLGLSAPLETHFIPYFAKTLFLWGDLAKRSNRARLLRAIFYFLEILLIQNHPGKEFNSIVGATLLATQEHFETILDESDSFGSLIRQLFGHYSQLHGKIGWVDNSSFYEIIPLWVWQRHLPDMKVIHIVRDGRDVVLSWLQSWWGPASLGEAAKLWSHHVTDKQNWGAANPGHYLEVCYETLLDHPESALEQIACFLGLQLEAKPIDLGCSPSARILSTGGTHDLLSGPIQTKNKEKWRRAMPSDDQQFFEFIAAYVLHQCGYPTLHQSLSFFQRLKFFPRRVWSQAKRFFSILYYAKKAKWGLPVFLYIIGPWGERVVRFLHAKKNILRLDDLNTGR